MVGTEDAVGGAASTKISSKTRKLANRLMAKTEHSNHALAYAYAVEAMFLSCLCVCVSVCVCVSFQAVTFEAVDIETLWC